MRKHQRIFPGGSAVAVPSTLRVLGGNLVPPHDTPGVVRVDTILEEDDFDTLDAGSGATTGAVTRSGGALTGVAVDDGGSAYKNVGDMSAAERDCTVTGGGGTGAVVRIGTVVGGVVTSFEVVDGGTGYTSDPNISVPGPTGEPSGLPWADGIGYGEIGGTRVLIVHDGRGPLQYAITKDQQFRVFAKSFTSALGFDVYVPLYAVAS